MKKLKSFLFVLAFVSYVAFWFSVGAKDEILEMTEEIRQTIQAEVR